MGSRASNRSSHVRLCLRRRVSDRGIATPRGGLPGALRAEFRPAARRRRAVVRRPRPPAHAPCAAWAVEPVYQGHTHYPFPGLRIGPSVTDVVECSNLCRETIALPMVAVRPGRFASTVFDDDRACFRAWAGSRVRNTGLVIPLHPWQLKLSPIVIE